MNDYSQLYDAVLALIEELMELDPETDSAEGRLLRGLIIATEEYEKVRFPMSRI